MNIYHGDTENGVSRRLTQTNADESRTRELALETLKK